MSLPLVAGAMSTTIFVLSMLPMLVKAGRTKDLSSYSLSNIVLSNLGNVVHSIYVFDLPAGPVWLLHSFYLVTSALMLFWYLRYRRLGQGLVPGPWRRGQRLHRTTHVDSAAEMHCSPDAAMPVTS